MSLSICSQGGVWFGGGGVWSQGYGPGRYGLRGVCFKHNHQTISYIFLIQLKYLFRITILFILKLCWEIEYVATDPSHQNSLNLGHLAQYCNHGANIILEKKFSNNFYLREMGVYRKKPKIKVKWKSAYYSDFHDFHHFCKINVQSTCASKLLTNSIVFKMYFIL